MNMGVRYASPKDAQAIAAIHESAIRDLAKTAYDDDVIETWASGKDPENYPIGTDGEYFLVTEIDGFLAGFGHLRPTSPDYLRTDVDGEIGAIYVHPDHVGQGVGRSMYEHLETYAVDEGVGSLGLWASINAVGFYETLGFDAVAKITHTFGGEVEGPAVEMVKEL